MVAVLFGSARILAYTWAMRWCAGSMLIGSAAACDGSGLAVSGGGVVVSLACGRVAAGGWEDAGATARVVSAGAAAGGLGVVAGAGAPAATAVVSRGAATLVDSGGTAAAVAPKLGQNLKAAKMTSAVKTTIPAIEIEVPRDPESPGRSGARPKARPQCLHLVAESGDF